jgi:signal transduction histidine kinase
VAALRGFAVTLTKRWGQLDDATILGMIQRMEQESVRLHDLAEEAGTVAYMEEETFGMQLHRERATDLARDASDAVHELSNRLRLTFDPHAEEAWVEADRSRLLQVFRNLLSNAAKYSNPDSDVQLLVEADDHDVTYSILDRGTGIADEDMPRLFQRFSRISAPSTTSVPGSGLGLYISRRIVEAHGGRIWAESTPGVGSPFAFAVPRVS